MSAIFRIIASLSHELRAPLTAIIGFQELLTDGIYGDLDPRSEEAVERIGSSAYQLLALIDTVIDVARIDAGLIEPALSHIQGDRLLAAAVDAAKDLASERGVEPVVTVHESVPTISTDAERLRTALDLVVSAAIRAAAGTELTFQAQTRDDEGLTVEALGTRIAPDTPILTPGANTDRLEPASDQSGHGQAVLRLGLAASLIRFLGGELELRPTEDTTTLRITLPPEPMERSGSRVRGSGT